MIECINQILELIISSAIIAGIIFLIYFYVKLKHIDSKIEKIHREFETKRDGKQGQGRGIPIGIIDGQITELKRKKDEEIAPLERERQVIISKVPFIK